MILIDANLLIYAHFASFPQHRRSREWLDGKLNGHARVGIPWMSILAFLRVVTNPRLFPKPDSISSAWRQVEEWLDCPVAWIPEPAEAHRTVLRTLLEQSQAAGSLVSDAHLAALAIEHGLTLCSTDGDFARFPGLRWENPIS